jgi:hypothetical protein
MTDKLPAIESLNYIKEKLLQELKLFPLDSPTRTKGQAFAIGGQGGKQFLLIMGNKGTGGAKQTRIITEQIPAPPSILGVRFSSELAGSARVNQETTSLGFNNRLKKNNQSSFYVSNLQALTDLIQWYVEKNA